MELTKENNSIKIKNIYFYVFVVTPLALLVAYFLNFGYKTSLVAFYIAAFTCAVLDGRELKKSFQDSLPQYIGDALAILIFPPVYTFIRARAVGMNRWGWFVAHSAIVVAVCLITGITDYNQGIRKSACETVTAIYKDKKSDLQCIKVENLKKVSERYYRANAMLTNGVDMPITIEDRGDSIYVTLTPLSHLLD